MNKVERPVKVYKKVPVDRSWVAIFLVLGFSGVLILSVVFSSFMTQRAIGDLKVEVGSQLNNTKYDLDSLIEALNSSDGNVDTLQAINNINKKLNEPDITSDYIMNNLINIKRRLQETIDKLESGNFTTQTVIYVGGGY